MIDVASQRTWRYCSTFQLVKALQMLWAIVHYCATYSLVVVSGEMPGSVFCLFDIVSWFSILIKGIPWLSGFSLTQELSPSTPPPPPPPPLDSVWWEGDLDVEDAITVGCSASRDRFRLDQDLLVPGAAAAALLSRDVVVAMSVLSSSVLMRTLKSKQKLP